MVSLGDADITLTNANSIDVEGNLANLTLIGASIDTVSTELLVVSANYQMNGTLIDDLEFASTSLLGSVIEIEVNTLSNVNIASIVAKITGESFNLISPITTIDIYNHNYDTQLASLEAQEVIDELRYNGFRTTAINVAWAEILTNTYMDHLDETATKVEIDNQTYQTVEQYFESFLLNIGETEEDYGVGPSTIARDAITATLGETVLTINEVDLDNEVTTSMEDDATTYATNEEASATYTIN